MDGAYNTSSSVSTRAIMGHSMGGYGAVSIAMRNPDVFSAVSTFGGVVDLTVTLEGITPWTLEENGGSGPFNPTAGVWTEILYSLSAAFSPDLNQNPYPVNLPIEDDGTVIDSVWTRWQLEDPPHIARQLQGSELGIYLHCGLEDELWIDANRALRDSLLLLDIPCRLDQFPGDHNNQLHVRIPLALQYFDSLFVGNETVIPTGRGALPRSIELEQNYPNPFNPTTTIEFALTNPGEIRLDVFNIKGQRVATLAEGVYTAGMHRATLNTGPRSVGAGLSRPLSSGVYIYQLSTGSSTLSRKMLLIR
jgi:hypothetical protein